MVQFFLGGGGGVIFRIIDFMWLGLCFCVNLKFEYSFEYFCLVDRIRFAGALDVS